MTAPDAPEGAAKGNQNVPKSAVERPQELSRLEKEKVPLVNLSHKYKHLNPLPVWHVLVLESHRNSGRLNCVLKVHRGAVWVQYLVLTIKDRFYCQGPFARMQTSGLQR